MNELSNLITNKPLAETLHKIAKQINHDRNSGKLVETPFTIGVMGKSGAGKSTIINALCQANVCKSGAVGGCTREIQRVSAKFGDMPVLLVDFPGIAENEKWNESYIKLYENYLEQIDVLLWVIKLDDRALVEDEAFFKEHIKRKFEEKTIFVLSQADKAEPTREWCNRDYLPSEKQKEIIQHKRHLLFEIFSNPSTEISPKHVVTLRTLPFVFNSFPKIEEDKKDEIKPNLKYSIVPVSVDYYQNKFRLYNFERLVELIFLKLTGYERKLYNPFFPLHSLTHKKTGILEQYGEALCKQIYQEDKDYVPLKKEVPKSSSHSSSSSSSSSSSRSGSVSVKRSLFDWF